MLHVTPFNHQSWFSWIGCLDKCLLPPYHSCVPGAEGHVPSRGGLLFAQTFMSSHTPCLDVQIRAEIIILRFLLKVFCSTFHVLDLLSIGICVLSWSVGIRLLFSLLDIQWPSIIHCISFLPEFESNNSVFVGLFMDPVFCFIWLFVYPCSILHYCNYYNLLSDNIVGYHCISAEQAGCSLL